MTTTAVLLAAGLGTRMNSALPKALHPIAGRPMLQHLIASCAVAFDRIVVVVGPGMHALERIAAPHTVVVQTERLGTAHAALQAAAQFGDGDVAVLYADNPLIRPATLQRLLNRRRTHGIALALLAMRPADPGRYGRVLTQADGMGGSDVERVVEWAEATAAEREVGLCNAGVLCASAADFLRWLRQVQPSPKGEYYLPDCVALARGEGRRVAAVERPAEELRGINSRAELAEAGSDSAGLAAPRGNGRRRDPDRSRNRVLQRRHGARTGRDGAAARGVRPRRERRLRRRDTRVQPP